MNRSVRPPFIFRCFDPSHLICRMNGREKKIFLTFDDGPVPEVTTEVLRILAAHGAHATFFMVGDNIRKHPEIFEKVVAGGHVAGNHTFHHLNGWKTSTSAYVDDIVQSAGLIGTKLFRPPYGRFTPAQYRHLKNDFLFVMWSLLTWDFSPLQTPETCLAMAVKHTRPGEIIVFHDSLKAAKNMLYALPGYLDAFSRQGYSFESLPQ